MSKEQLEALEALIDSYDVARVLEAMAEICHAKASHIQENWQDDKTAKEWDRIATKIKALSSKVSS